MLELSELSPLVLQVLEENHFKPKQVLRYGPRYVCLVVTNGEQEGFFKMVLPIEERHQYSPEGYIWTEYDYTDKLEQRLLKEALFLQFFSQQIGGAGFEPQIISFSDTSPVWSLRNYIHERTMSAWNSDFVFSPRFFTTISPQQAADFFAKLHQVSHILPQNLSDMIAEVTSTLTNKRRFHGTAERAAEVPEFSAHADRLLDKFISYAPKYRDYEPKLTHYEPYPPHIFSHKSQMGLIDWENIGWGHSMQDFSVLYMRCFMDPDWQKQYLKTMEDLGYFEGNGRLYWDSEMLIQGFANHKYFAEGGPSGTEEYDKKAIKFFIRTIEEVLADSPYFKA